MSFSTWVSVLLSACFWEGYLKMAFFPQSVLFDVGHLPPSEHLFLQTISKKTLGPLGPWFPWAPWCSLEQSRLLPSEQPFLKTIFKKTPGLPRGPCFLWAPWCSFDQNHLPPLERPCLESAVKKPPGYASQKGCVEGGKRPTSKRTLWGRKVTF